LNPPRTLVVDNPFSGEPACEVAVLDEAAALAALGRSARAQRDWAQVAVADRAALVLRFADQFLQRKEAFALQITRMMGKPIAQARAEVDTMVARARSLAAQAPEALAEVALPPLEGFQRWVAREPLGVVLDIAPWNYPLLTAVNAVVPAVLAGNGVLLKPSRRTPLCGDQFELAFKAAGAPAGLVQSVFADHATCEALMAQPEVGHVAFTGSVFGGHAVSRTLATRFIGATLELGGKDSAYVAEDADLDHAVANLADGAFYNAGQSCCGIKRIYVHRRHHAKFLEGLAAAVRKYQPGDPETEGTTLGPLALAGAPEALSKQVGAARQQGARVLGSGKPTRFQGKGRFLEPTIVAAATHEMALMREESFGPVVGVAEVPSDEAALALMNDSPFGLTAAIWTSDPERARRLGAKLQVGTVFMNRCDYLDPMLPWVGVKDSGRGLSLSRWGLQEMTRAKSYNLRLKVKG
jgi:acyl-CoA reductase-like NAD-dependent aldehyde dehydrogenase